MTVYVGTHRLEKRSACLHISLLCFKTHKQLELSLQKQSKTTIRTRTQSVVRPRSLVLPVDGSRLSTGTPRTAGNTGDGSRPRARALTERTSPRTRPRGCTPQSFVVRSTGRTPAVRVPKRLRLRHPPMRRQAPLREQDVRKVSRTRSFVLRNFQKAYHGHDAH